MKKHNREADRGGLTKTSFTIAAVFLCAPLALADTQANWQISAPAPFSYPSVPATYDNTGRQQVWDVRAQFSNTTNPNAEWAYGYSVTRLTGFILSTSNDQSVQPGVYDWYAPANGVFPGVLYSTNATTLSIYGGTVTLPAGGVGLQPGSAGQFATVQWTCPTNGQYKITAQFTGRSAELSGYSEVSVLRNGLQMYYSVIRDPRQIAILGVTLDMTTGETLAFAAGKGGDGADKDLKSLDCVIQRVPRLCVGDINGDGIVDSTDMGILLAHYGQSVPPSDLGDLDGNGIINSTDLGLLLNNFGCTS